MQSLVWMERKLPEAGSPTRGSSWRHSGKQSDGENMCWDGENMRWDVTSVAGCALPGHPPACDPLSHTRCGDLDE